MSRDFPTQDLPDVPTAFARYATTPIVLETFKRLTAIFDEQTSLSPIERETVVFAVARRNGCDLCVAFHSWLLSQTDAPPSVVAAMRGEAPFTDARLAALDAFTRSALDRTGDVEARVWNRFLAAGFSHRQALEVIFGIATYTLSTFANRLVEAPIEGPLRTFV